MAEEKDLPIEEFTIDDALLEQAEREHAAAVAAESEDVGVAKPKRGRKKKPEKEEIHDGVIENVTPTDEPKPKRGRKKKAEGEATTEPAAEDAAPTNEPKPKRGRKKTAEGEEPTEPAAEDTAPTNEPKPKRGRKKTAEGEEPTEPAAEDAAPTNEPKPKRGRKKTAEGEEPTEPVAEDAAVTVTDDVADVMHEADLPEVSLEDERFASVEDEITLFDDVEDISAEVIADASISDENIDSVLEDAEKDETDTSSETGEPQVRVRKREAKYDPDNPRRIDFIFDFIELFVYTLVAVLVITTFFVRHSVVDGPSMESTLQSGDTLILSNLFYTPTVGDVVVVDDHTTGLPYPIVKRVIAVGGQWVRIARDGVYVDGERLDEPYVYTDGMNFIYTSRLPGEALMENPTFTMDPPDGKHGIINYYEFRVPEGEIFIMGDHRNESTDSRVIGTVRVDAVLGKVLFRVLPFSSFGAIE